MIIASELIIQEIMRKNILLSISVQVISLLVSFIMGLIIPKVIDEYQYALWQMFVLYVGYIGVLHFGLLDGIVLRYSQYNYEDIDKVRVRSQFQTLFFSNILISILVIVYAVSFLEKDIYVITILVAVGIVTKNLLTYNSFTFQITNRINKYAILVIAQRACFGIIVVGLMIFGVKDFYLYCIAELLSDVIASLIGAAFNKGMYFGSVLSTRDNLIETKLNISSGIKLMFANWSAMLLIGSAKMLIQWKFDTVTFGKVSFAFSISSLFLTFVSAISIVLFPSIKRMKVDKLPLLYKKIRDIISPVLFIVMIFYFPGAFILNIWLPKYQVSLSYLGILLPIIIFSSKISLLTNNYLKAYRKENFMFYVNVMSVVISVVAFSGCLLVFKSINSVLVCVVLMIMFRSVISEIAVMRVIGVWFYKDFCIETIMTLVFILCASLLGLIKGCIIYTFALGTYLIINRKSIKLFISQFK